MVCTPAWSQQNSYWVKFKKKLQEREMFLFSFIKWFLAHLRADKYCRP